MKSKNLLPTIYACILCFVLSTAKGQTQYKILPSQANAAVSQNNDSIFAYINTPAAKLNKLFLFMPGTGAKPAYYLQILKVAANLGYHAIGISYVNDQAVNTLCNRQAADCQERVRAEVFYGKDYSPLVSVDTNNSIRTRLISMLKYLQNSHPSDNWGQFLTAQDSVDWDRVCVSGHSQGAGMASIIAYWYSVNRGVFFSSGGDVSAATNGVATWMTLPSKTWAGSKFSFAHRQDELLWGNSNYTPAIWNALQLQTFGNYLSVDTLTNKYYGRHAFTSNAAINGSSSLKYHNCTVVDFYTPMNGGIPVFQPLWQYMLTNNPTNIDNVTIYSKKITLFPNPGNGLFHLELKGNNEPLYISITDIQGREIYTKTTTDSSLEIDLKARAVGVYLLNVISNNQRETFKLVVVSP